MLPSSWFYASLSSQVPADKAWGQVGIYLFSRFFFLECVAEIDGGGWNLLQSTRRGSVVGTEAPSAVQLALYKRDWISKRLLGEKMLLKKIKEFKKKKKKPLQLAVPSLAG